MRKQLKKLSLSRETLRSLEERGLGTAAGGSADTSMACFIATGCDCGSNDCYAPTMCLWGCSMSAETCRC